MHIFDNNNNSETHISLFVIVWNRTWHVQNCTAVVTRSLSRSGICVCVCCACSLLLKSVRDDYLIGYFSKLSTTRRLHLTATPLSALHLTWLLLCTVYTHTHTHITYNKQESSLLSLSMLYTAAWTALTKRDDVAWWWVVMSNYW